MKLSKENLFWSRFNRQDGLLAALAVIPAIVLILSGHVVPGLAFTIGTLPTLQFGISPRRKQRVVSSILGTLFGLGIFVGSYIGRIDSTLLIALVIFVIAFVAAIGASRRRAGVIMTALILPALTVGLSYDNETALSLFFAFALGSLWTGLMTLFWPETNEEQSEKGMKVFVADDPKLYGLLLGSAAATAILIGFNFDPQFPGWAATATLLIMRPLGGMVKSRGMWRAIATVLGSVLAVITIQLVVPEFVTALLVLGVMVLAFGTLKSGWWLVPLCTAYFILTMNLLDITSAEVVRETAWQRIADNLIGAGIALLFGLAIPTLINKYRKN